MVSFISVLIIIASFTYFEIYVYFFYFCKVETEVTDLKLFCFPNVGIWYMNFFLSTALVAVHKFWYIVVLCSQIFYFDKFNLLLIPSSILFTARSTRTHTLIYINIHTHKYISSISLLNMFMLSFTIMNIWNITITVA